MTKNKSAPDPHPHSLPPCMYNHFGFYIYTFYYILFFLLMFWRSFPIRTNRVAVESFFFYGSIVLHLYYNLFNQFSVVAHLAPSPCPQAFTKTMLQLICIHWVLCTCQIISVRLSPRKVKPRSRIDCQRVCTVLILTADCSP